MPWTKGERIPTNLIVGFLGSGKTTAISKLLRQRPAGEHWSILVNEFGSVSIDHALVDSSQSEVAIEKLGGGCACCTMSFVFKPLLAQFIRRSKPDRLILEPSGLSHPAKVVDILRSENFAAVIDLQNIICLVDPKDIDDPRWKESEVFQDQVQLADIVALNWTDSRDRDLIDRCRSWVDRFDPPKQLIVETEFGVIDPKLLDLQFSSVRFPLFEDAHPMIDTQPTTFTLGDSKSTFGLDSNNPSETFELEIDNCRPTPGRPRRFQNAGTGYGACGWVFHVEDTFDRDKLLNFIGQLRSVARLKGVFRCRGDWWSINRAKDATDFSTTTYRRDSRLEVIQTNVSTEWNLFENGLLDCLIDR